MFCLSSSSFLLSLSAEYQSHASVSTEIATPKRPSHLVAQLAIFVGCQGLNL